MQLEPIMARRVDSILVSAVRDLLLELSRAGDEDGGTHLDWSPPWEAGVMVNRLDRVVKVPKDGALAAVGKLVAPRAKLFRQLTEAEERVLAAMAPGVPLGEDELATAARYKPRYVHDVLVQLWQDGAVFKGYGGVWVRG